MDNGIEHIYYEISSYKNSNRIKKVYMIVGMTIIIIVIIAVLVSIVSPPYDSDTIDVANTMAKPSKEHIMGCDNFGRDIFTRVLVGAKNTIIIALGTLAIGAGFGIILGSITGYFGGLLDKIIMSLNDTLFSFPAILLALIFISLRGPSKGSVVPALGIAFIPSFTRMVRGEYIRLREMDYVKWAKVIGVSPLRIMYVHIFPNIINVLLPAIIIGFNNAVLTEAGLSYLGIGVQPPTSSLGRMLQEASAYIFSNPTYVLFPGITIIIIILGMSFIGEAVSSDI